METEEREANQAWLTSSPPSLKGASTMQVALAWLLAQRPWFAPFPGTRRPERLAESLGEADAGLTAADLARIQSAADEIQIRYRDM